MKTKEVVLMVVVLNVNYDDVQEEGDYIHGPYEGAGEEEGT